MIELKPCPFCGRTPKVLQRPGVLDGYFCAISCFCGGYSATAHQSASDENEAEAHRKAVNLWNRRVGNDTKVATNADYTRNMRKEEQHETD
jgi:Lar family restriction alleviation protein